MVSNVVMRTYVRVRELVSSIGTSAGKVALVAFAVVACSGVPAGYAAAANEFPNGMVTLSFDDGTKSIFNNINILDAANFKSTQYIISGAMECADAGVGCSDFMTSANVLALFTSGHEIAAHTRTDPDGGSAGLSINDLLFQVDALRQDLLTKIGLPVSTFAYPFGLHDANLIAKLKSAGIVGARTVDLIDANAQIVLNGTASDRYLLNAGQVNAETPVTTAETPVGWNFGTVESWIDQAVAQKKWLVLIFHKIDPNCSTSGVPLPPEEGGGFDISCTTPTKLQEIVAHLQSKGSTVDVVTMKEGLSRMNSNPTSGAATPVISLTEAVADVVTAEATSTTSIGAAVTFTPVVVDSDAVNAPAPLNALCTINVPKYPATPSNPLGGHPVWGTNYNTIVSSGSIFPLGTTAVTCTSADVAGNTGTKVFSVVVQAAQAPVIAAHADVYAVAPTSAGVAVTYTNPTVTDNVDATIAATCAPASGSTFAVGSTTVTCNAHDTAGNNATPTTFVVGVSVAPAPILIELMTSSLPNGTQNSAYAQTLTASTSLLGNLTWLISGSLPAGLSLGSSISTTNTISGTPTATGASTFSVVVGNGLSTTTRSYTITIDAPAPVVTPPSNGSGPSGGSGGGGIVGSGPFSIGYVTTNSTSQATNNGSVLGASVGGLTEEQIQAILSLLRSFNADESVIHSVDAALRGSGTVGGGTFTKTLMQGSVGTEVTMLQKVLADFGFLKISTPTGFFGTLTKVAVMGYQTSRGIEAVGIVGPKTRAALNGAAVASSEK
ncbi:MAG: HYR domain-containing protein [Patescibacteria group bacterium]